MRCEVCGRKIHGEPIRSLIEGAKLTVCHECSKHGTIIYEEPKPATNSSRPRATRVPLTIVAKKPSRTIVDTSIELVENFSGKIRQAREKIGISHDDLGKKLNEKVSQLRKIETGKMKPDNKLATKLERILKIKLIVPASEEKVSEAKLPKVPSEELTLGDLMPTSEKKKGETKGRKQS